MPKNSFYLKKLTESDFKEELKYPLKPKHNGKMEKCTRSIDILTQRIKFFLVTGFNERLMESELGSGIPNIIGRQLTDDKLDYVKNLVQTKLSEEFRNVIIRNVEIINQGQEYEIEVDLKYKDTIKSSYFDEDFDKLLYENNYFTINVKLTS